MIDIPNIKISELFYNLPKLNLHNEAEDALSDFICNTQIYLIQTEVNANSLNLTTKIVCNSQKSIIFYKTSPLDLSKEDVINNINIITITEGAAESLYQILRQIFNPLLTLGDDLYTNKLQKNLFDLETNLRAIAHGRNSGNLNVVLSVEDEVNYWKAMGEKRDISKKEREAASNFCVLFEDVCEEIRSMKAVPLQDVRDNAENVGGILDDIWRYTLVQYPQDRMTHILDIIGHVICAIIQKALSGIDLWRVHNDKQDNETLKLISESVNVVQTWIGACTSLTETYWPNYALHPWAGEGYVPQFCLNFERRTKEM
ncbi:unnamed protein product, partial [Iphiclides podalirius]